MESIRPFDWKLDNLCFGYSESFDFDEKFDECLGSPIKISLSYNCGVDWINLTQNFTYHNNEVFKPAFAYNFVGKTSDTDKREVEWLAELPEEKDRKFTSEEEKENYE